VDSGSLALAARTSTRAALAGGLAALALAWASATAHGQEGRPNQTVETGSAVATPADGERSFTWDLSWAGWRGLQYELIQRVEVGGPDRLIPQRVLDERVGLRGRIGGKLALDGAAFFTTGGLSDLDDGFEIRRARLYTMGEIYLVIPVLYKVEISFVGDVGIVVEQNYLGVRNVPVVQSVFVGNLQTPFALEDVTSGRDLTFMEIAAPTQAFAPGIKAGILFGGPVLDNRMTWGFGWFSGSGSTELGSFSGQASSIGRVTWLPVDRERDGSRDLVHLGLSANISLGSADPVRYQARPESHLAPFIVDTGDIDANNAYLVGFEAAMVRGPLSLQGELFHSAVDDKRGGMLNFGGLYVYGSWLLTGESRPYDRAAGVFARLQPRRDLSLRGGGLGAVELGVRYSHVDLNDGPVRGGIMDLGTIGLNWYWNPYVKMKFNYVIGGVRGNSQNGNLQILQARFELDF
jgi:phosphate-selective porin OprO/OprP